MNHERYDTFDPLLRVRVLAAALPGSVVAERSLNAKFEQVWRVVTDLETMAPRYETNVTAVQYVERSPEKNRIIASLRGGYEEEMDVRIVRGWCLMQSQSFVIAFGARPEGSRTLLSHLEQNRTGTVSTLTVQQLYRAQEMLVRELDAIEALAAGFP